MNLYFNCKSIVQIYLKSTANEQTINSTKKTTKDSTKNSTKYHFAADLFAIMWYVCDDTEGELQIKN